MMRLGAERIPGGPAVTVTVNDRPVQAHRGQTVHAALVAAGFLSVHKSKIRHSPRGPFCGMGVCYECLVTINGEPNQRACMRLVSPGMEIRIDADNL